MNKYSKIFFIVIIILIVVSCVEREAPNTPLEHFEKLLPEKINISRLIDLGQYEIYKPASVIKDKNGYITYSQTTKDIIANIDINKNIVTYGLNRGEAPIEIISPSSFHKVGNDFFIYDIARKIIYNIIKDDNGILISNFKKINIQERLFVVNVAPKGFIASGLFEEAWLTFYNSENEVTSFLKFPEFENTRNMTNIEKSSIYISSVMSLSPDFTKFVCATPNAGVISFSNIVDNKLVEYKRLEYNAPLVEVPRAAGASSIAFNRNNLVSFCGLSCDDHYIYALYSGRTFNTHATTSHYCEHILIYDWDGEPIKHLLLEKPLYSMMYDHNNKIIYGIGYDPEGVIIEYNLKNIF